MMKLLLGRLMPAGVAAAILTSALSPLRPAIDAFGAAAVALTGQEPAPVEGGADFGSDLIPQAPKVGQAKPKEQKRKLQELASRMRDPNAPKIKQFQAPSQRALAPRRPDVRLVRAAFPGKASSGPDAPVRQGGERRTPRGQGTAGATEPPEASD